MNPIKKLKNKRGMTLVEVLMVVALMAIMLGIAMPDLLSESEAIKMTELNSNARAVAVAVQSKLYGMKNKGTAEGSEFYIFDNRNNAKQININTAEGEKNVKYFANFGDDAEVGKQILSGALTDVELLNNKNIVVVYSPVTADVVEVFYAENEFSVADNIDNFFPTVKKAYLDKNHIGLYRGDPQPEIEYNIGLPRFSVAWGDDDEKYLELTMIGTPATELLDKPLGLEVYALLPQAGSDDYDPLLIYTEGLVATDYRTESVVENHGYSTASQTIKSEAGAPLTLKKIQDNKGKDNKGKLRFVIDSMVIAVADYNNYDVKSMLYRQNAPTYVSMAEEMLYPRESLGNWLNKKFNPYISFGTDAGLYKISSDLQTKLDKEDAKVTDFVLPNQKIGLRVKLYVLKESSYTVSIGNSTGTRYVEDTDYASVTIDSQPANPYFYSASSTETEISLASVRDLQNLRYIFETENETENAVTRAQLYHDIDIQDFYNKLVFVRYALIKKNPDVKKQWAVYANGDTLQITQITYADGKDNGRDGFTISGDNGKGGRYAIKNVQTGGANWTRGGIIEYAKNITVENLDVVNPKIWKIDYKANFIDTDVNGKITGIHVEWDNCVSGGLFGVAENCTFKNVHCYNDSTQNFKQEPFDAESYAPPATWVPSVMAARYISGSVAGGLVGIAVGTEGTGTTFTNCSASTQINSYYYGAMAQCVYAGGLVGIAIGNVTIKNSYAACQLSGYYSGGLVGAVAEGPFKYHCYYRKAGYWLDNQYIDGWWEADYNNGVYGTLTIENSFSAGHIQRQTMVGGGLIAQTNDINVTVTNCYSASVWEILPPFAYGTFEGDDKNYYLVQNEINVPITLNTEARFTRPTGDVLSLSGKSSGKSSGKAVTALQLKDSLVNNSLVNNWKDATSTLRWLNKGNSGVPTFERSTEPSTGYPFLMPKDNTEFRGDWNQKPATTITNKFAADFDGFYCVYFKMVDDGYQRFIDASAVLELQFDFLDNSPKLLNKEIQNSVTTPENIWWADNERPEGKGYVEEYGTGVAGMTEVSVKGEDIIFTGAPYYNSNYNPTKGYVDIDIIGNADGESRYLNWDYYGWFISNGLLKLNYLTQPPKGEPITVLKTQITQVTQDGQSKKEEINKEITVDEFKGAIGYDSFNFKKEENQTEIAYDGYFHVSEWKEA